jgi:hypothetical protein
MNLLQQEIYLNANASDNFAIEVEPEIRTAKSIINTERKVTSFIITENTYNSIVTIERIIKSPII